MKLASIELISEIKPHSNAERLEIAHVLGYDCIVAKAIFHVGEAIVFIQPDTVLPDVDWAKVYKAKSNRVKAIRLRGLWSEGIIESLSILPKNKMDAEGRDIYAGYDVSEILGVTKYEPPMPQDLQAKGGLPFGLPITDEERYQNINPLPFGEKVDVTLKRDGKSWTGYAIQDPHTKEWHSGICGRKLEYKLDAMNDYTMFKDCLPKLLDYARNLDTSLVIRGEITGFGIQAFKSNPHCHIPKELRIFSVYLPEARAYAGKGDYFYYKNVAPALGLQTVETLEEDVTLTPELIKKYAEDLTEINHDAFEGVVIKGKDFSFKVINKHYDSLK